MKVSVECRQYVPLKEKNNSCFLLLYAIKNDDSTTGDIWRNLKHFDISSDITGMDFPLTSLYNNYNIIVDGVSSSGTGDIEFNLVMTDVDGDITTGAYQYSLNEYKSDGVSKTYFANSEVNMPLSKSVTGGNMISCCININNKNGVDSNGDYYTSVEYNSQTKLSSGFLSNRGYGIVNHTKELQSIRIEFNDPSTNNISTGKATLYAIKKTHVVGS